MNAGEAWIEDIVNPFMDWREDQQTFDAGARTPAGAAVSTIDPSAVCWCAWGWLMKLGVDEVEIAAFSVFLMHETLCGLVMSNDNRRLTPRQFEAEWDRWKETA